MSGGLPMRSNAGLDETERPIGLSTMSPAMAEMHQYQRYLFDQIRPELGRRVWEIGVGHGTLTRWLLESDATVLGTDIDEECLRRLAAVCGADQRLTTAQVDLCSETSIRVQSAFQADTIVCINVLEHIERDVAALGWLREAAAPDATFLLIVPAHPRLFGQMDREAGHFRRYTRSSATSALQEAGWRVERAAYRNFLGALGWWYHNRWRQTAGLRDNSANRQMRIADRWLPRIARWTDPCLGRVAGLSVLAVARAR